MAGSERIVVQHDVIRGERDRKPLWQCRLHEIVRIEAYKRNQIAVDLICFDIAFELDGEQWMATVHEDLAGWDSLIAAFRLLADFDRDWFAKVSQPPFTECRTVVYERL